ncbi:hypothetical protein VTO73DRAFT_13859 [Trametes versicolor]
MTALPSAADAAPLLLGGSPIPQALSIYEHVILPAESAALLKAEEAPIVYARVLGYLFLYPPSDEARRCLTLELASCNSTDDPSKAVFQLGAVTWIGLIVPPLALVRDDFRCMVTGKVDFKAYMKGLALPVSGEHVTMTRCCHIFPDSLGKFTVDATTGKSSLLLVQWASEDVEASRATSIVCDEVHLVIVTAGGAFHGEG